MYISSSPSYAKVALELFAVLLRRAERYIHAYVTTRSILLLAENGNTVKRFYVEIILDRIVALPGQQIWKQGLSLFQALRPYLYKRYTSNSAAPDYL